MKKYLSLLAASVLLSGCGADVAGACSDYVTAANACNDDYATASGVDPSTVEVSATFCDAYGKYKDQSYVDYFSCLSDAYSSADCTDSNAYAGIATAQADCTPPSGK